MLLEKINAQITEYRENDNPHIELTNFISETFSSLLKGCQRYLKLFNDLLVNYGAYLNPEADIREQILIMKNDNHAENTERLITILNKVLLVKA